MRFTNIMQVAGQLATRQPEHHHHPGETVTVGQIFFGLFNKTNVSCQVFGGEMPEGGMRERSSPSPMTTTSLTRGYQEDV